MEWKPNYNKLALCKQFVWNQLLYVKSNIFGGGLPVLVVFEISKQET